MVTDLPVILFSAGTIAFLHTILGPDHYLPFVAMSKSGQWSLRKTSIVTILCGSGHVLSSVLLGVAGVGFGVALSNITFLQSIRGNLAAWALIAFGLVYSIWGIRIAIRNRPHKHFHSHDHGFRHDHLHKHYNTHLHPHIESAEKYLGKPVTSSNHALAWHLLRLAGILDNSENLGRLFNQVI